MKRTLETVFDDISEWSNSFGTFYSLGGQFEDGSILQVNKKERHYAQELRETLLQLIGIECDYICDDAGQSKNGNQKWKLKAIVDLEGGPIYGNPPNVGALAGGSRSPSARDREYPASRSLAPTSSDKDAEIRAAVALKAAVEYGAGVNDLDFVKRVANELYEWLESKSSGPVQSSEARPPSATTPAGSDTTSAGADLGEASAPAGPTSEGVAVSGKDPAPSGPKRYTGSPPPGWVTEGE